MAIKPCEFLDVPGEIRNLIYDLVIEDITTPQVSKAGCVASPPIASVCRQIQDEVQRSGYLEHAIRTRPSIQAVEAQVTDGYFHHVVKFLSTVAKCSFMIIDKLKIRPKLTNRRTVDTDVLDWIDSITKATPNSDIVHAIANGRRSRQPVKISYEVDVAHKVQECPCGTFAHLVYRQTESFPY